MSRHPKLRCGTALAVSVIISSAPLMSAQALDAKAERQALFDVFSVTHNREPTQEEVEADFGWYSCTEHAADLFSSQPEPAEKVVEAAIEACAVEGLRYMSAFNLRYSSALGDAEKPALMARVMALRAATASRPR